MSAYVAQEEDIYTKDGTTDYRHKPAVKSKTGTWKACPYILGLSPSFPVCLVCAHGHMLSAKFYAFSLLWLAQFLFMQASTVIKKIKQKVEAN